MGAFTSADTHWNVNNMIYGDDNTGIPSIAAMMQSGNLYVYVCDIIEIKTFFEVFAFILQGI